MLDGITVLSKATINVYGGWSFISVHWLLISIIVSLFALNIYMIFKEEDFSFLGLSSMLLLITMFMFRMIGLDTKVVDTYDQYKVLINEEVSMKEFAERYEILDQDGLIYIIKEK